MTEAESAWLGGLLEGEGSFLHWEVRGGKENVVRVQMGTTDLDVLQRVAAMTGIGSPRPVAPQHNKLGTKPFWLWSINSRADVRELVLRLWPWLGERRRGQARRILDSTEGLVIRPVGVCSRGHRIEGANAQPNGRSFACKTCINERRRRQARERRAAT